MDPVIPISVCTLWHSCYWLKYKESLFAESEMFWKVRNVLKSHLNPIFCYSYDSCFLKSSCIKFLIFSQTWFCYKFWIFILHILSYFSKKIQPILTVLTDLAQILLSQFPRKDLWCFPLLLVAIFLITQYN